MNESECIDKLNLWAVGYIDGWSTSLKDSIVFRFDDIPAKTTMGYYYRQTFYSLNGDRYEHVIVLDTKLLKFPNFLIESVLWHEFCHLWVRFECGVVIDSHGKEFKNRQKTVLRYWLGDYITKFCWGLI